MKTNSIATQRASILLVALLTITILALLCATSLHITTQNANAGMQTASWQQALTGAETAVDHAINALNDYAANPSSSAWNFSYNGTTYNWYTVSNSTLPTTQPSGGSAASAPPTSSQYNYLVAPAVSLQGEGNSTVTSWVTIDTAGLPLDQNGNQWYRIRATGVTGVPGPGRVSNNKLDNNLRMIAVQFDRKAGIAISTPQASRTIEVIAQANAGGVFDYGLLVANSITMDGGGYIDSFYSHNPPTGYSSPPNGLWSLLYRTDHGNIGMNNSGTNSNLNGMYVYGNLSYSGPQPVAGTNNVIGGVSTPFNVPIPTTSDPTQLFAGVTGSGNGSLPSVVTAGTQQQPTLYKFNNLTVNAGGNVVISPPPPPPPPQVPASTYYVTIWVTGTLKLNGGATITQAPNVKVTYYLDNGATINGGALVNPGYAQNLSIIGVGNGQTFKLSGGAPFVGTVDAPGWQVNLSGQGDFSGAFIGNTLNITGGARVHYDQALEQVNGSGGVSNYAFASWFEDNSDPARGIIY